MTPRPTRSFGFNGAVDEHRRSPPSPSRSRGRATRCFNGAVDEHRRSQEGQQDRENLLLDASMGPSMSIDGVLQGIQEMNTRAAMLQWGRR